MKPVFTLVRGCAAAILILVPILLSGCGGSDDPGGTIVTEPTTAAGYTNRGWDRYEAGNFSGALADFQSAIVLDSTYGPAQAGQGWTLLEDASSASAMEAVAAVFDEAAALGESGAYVLAGRAAAHLGQGGSALADAVSDARTAWAVAPQFVFEHRASITAADLRLIEAFGQAGQGDLTAALVAADLVADSGILAGNSVTWLVDGTTYDSFEGAVLAHLMKLSEEYSG